MAATQRIEELLQAMQEQGYWTPEQVREIYAMTGRDAGYIPEGCEDWMVEDGVPRAYDKVRRDLTEAELKLDAPPPRPAEPAELAKSKKQGALIDVADYDARLKTVEATLTDLYRRLKALEERIIDPSA